MIGVPSCCFDLEDFLKGVLDFLKHFGKNEGKEGGELLKVVL